MALIVLWGFAFGSATFFGGNMQNAVVDLAVSAAKHGRLDITPYHSNSPDVALRDGAYDSGMAPGASLLALPAAEAAVLACKLIPTDLRDRVERAGRRRALSAWSIFGTPDAIEQLLTHAAMTVVFGFLGGALAFWIMGRIALGLTGDRAAARVVPVVYAFCTVMAYYHASYYTQSIGVLLILLAIDRLWVTRGGPWDWLAGGFCCGLAGAVDYPFFAYGGIVVAFSAARVALKHGLPRRLAWLGLAWLGIGFAIPLCLTMLYHQACFGGPLTTPYAYRVVAFHRHGLAGVQWPSLRRLADLLAGPEEGLLWLMPATLLFPLGAWRLLAAPDANRHVNDMNANANDDPNPDAPALAAWSPSRRRVFVLMALGLILAAGLYFTSVPWASNMASYGPRFFLVAVPFMTLLAWPHGGRGRALLAVLAASGFVVNQFGMISSVGFPSIAWDALRGRAAPPVVIRLFLGRVAFGPAKGLFLACACGLLLVALVLGIPKALASRRDA
jgi:hypothetical protein